LRFCRFCYSWSGRKK